MNNKRKQELKKVNIDKLPEYAQKLNCFILKNISSPNCDVPLLSIKKNLGNLDFLTINPFGIGKKTQQ